jgi:hypothetical protein
VVEDGGDAIRSQLPDADGHVLASIVDRDGAQFAHALLLAGAGGPDHANARVPGKLDQGGADAAGCAQDYDRLPFLYPSRPVQHAPGRDAVHNHRLRGDGVEAVGDGRQLTGL